MIYKFLWLESTAHLIPFVYFSELVGNFDETSKGEWEECARIDKKISSACTFVGLWYWSYSRVWSHAYISQL